QNVYRNRQKSYGRLYRDHIRRPAGNLCSLFVVFAPPAGRSAVALGLASLFSDETTGDVTTGKISAASVAAHARTTRPVPVLGGRVSARAPAQQAPLRRYRSGPLPPPGGQPAAS